MWWLLNLAVADPLPRPAAVGYLDSADGRMRCHYQRAEDLPLCEEALGWLAEAWTAQVTLLGFREPPPDRGIGGNDALDLYFTRDAGGAGSAWVDCVDGDPGCVDADPDNPVSDAASFIVVDPRTHALDLPHFIHHEFNHTLQYGTDYAEPFLSLWEGTAVFAERATDPSWPTLSGDFADYQATPWLSAILQDGYYLWDHYEIWSNYEYGAVGWVWWMDERWGAGDGLLVAQIWEAVSAPTASAEPDVLDAWEAVSGGWRSDMVAFAADRSTWGTAMGPEWQQFAGAAAYAAREASVTGDDAVTLEPAHPPYPLGTSYFDLTVVAGERFDLHLVPATGDADAWALVAQLNGSVEELSLQQRWSAAGDGVMTLGAVYLGPSGLDADDPLSPSSFTLSITPVRHTGTDPQSKPATDACGCATASSSVFSVFSALPFVLWRARRRRDQTPERPPLKPLPPAAPDRAQRASPPSRPDRPGSSSPPPGAFGAGRPKQQNR